MKQGGYRNSGRQKLIQRAKSSFFASFSLQWQRPTIRPLEPRGSSSIQFVAAGFTIVETLIVMAVTAALFVSVIILLGDRQAKTQFTTSINSVRQQLQQIINETNSGYYPNSGNFTCNGSTSPVTFTSGPGNNAQGTNGGCIFLGKAIQFGSDTDSSQLAVLPIAGNQYSAGSPIQTLAQAKPRAIFPANANVAESAIPQNLLSLTTMQYGLTVATANNAGADGCPNASFGGICFYTAKTAANPTSTPYKTGILAFLAGDSSGNIASAASYGLQSGSQLMTLYGVANSQPNQSATVATNAIGNVSGGGTNLQAADHASICLASDGTNQSGLITIDGGLQVKLVIYEDKQC